MTTPDNPYGNPGQNPPPPPGYGPPPGQAPGYGQTPGYGQPPSYGAPQYGNAPAYQQYGQAPTGNFGGQLVSWPIRVVSAIIDGIPSAILSSIGTASHSAGVYSLMSLLSLAYIIWNLVRQGRTGQTIGKSAMGTYCVRESDGQPIGAGLSIGRGILHIVDFIPCLLGFLWPLWDAKKQTFADKIVGSVVVKR